MLEEQWDQDTTLEQLEAYQTERPFPRKDNRPSSGCPQEGRPRNDRPQRVFMDNATWAKIDTEDRRAWLRISETAKKNILEYGAVRKNSFQPGGSRPQPSAGTQFQCTTNVHELEFEDTPEQQDKGDSPLIEARTHERHGQGKKSP